MDTLIEDIEDIVIKLRLPQQLKEFIVASKSIKTSLNEDILYDIEDLYIFYKSFYMFNDADFGTKTVLALKKCKDKNTFYYYLKKVLESELDYELLREEDRDVYRNIKINEIHFYRVVQEVTIRLIDLIDQIYNKEIEIDLVSTYKSIGKLELITKLTDEDYYKDLLKSALKVIQDK